MAIPPSSWPSRIYDQNFGMCIAPHEFLFPFYTNYSNYYRPWKLCTQTVAKDFGSTISNEKEQFKVTLDVQHFLPNELSVKVVNNQIIVEGRHEEKKDEHGFVSRHFTRRYTLPSSCMPEDVISNLSSDGVLTILANKSKEQLKNEQIVPITLCQSCPLKGNVPKSADNTDQKAKCAESKNLDLNKTNKQIMLKEDHCCLLLKPELLREAAVESEIKSENKKEKVDQDKIKACQGSKNTSEMLEQTFAKASAILSDEKCNKTDIYAMSKLELMEQKPDKLKPTCSAIGERVSAGMSTSEEILEQSFSKSSESKLESEEKFDLFDKSEDISEQAAGHSRMSKAEMSELSSTSSKTSKCIESSSSYKATVTTNMQEISEELSDFVCDILSSELDKSLEIKK